jgi:hypothetical protein
MDDKNEPMSKLVKAGYILSMIIFISGMLTGIYLLSLISVIH